MNNKDYSDIEVQVNSDGEVSFYCRSCKGYYDLTFLDLTTLQDYINYLDNHRKEEHGD